MRHKTLLLDFDHDEKRRKGTCAKCGQAAPLTIEYRPAGEFEVEHLRHYCACGYYFATLTKEGWRRSKYVEGDDAAHC